MRALIDGDLLVYEAAFAASEGSSQDVLEILEAKIDGIVKRSLSEEYTIYLTGVGNFREKIAVSRKYKGNRTREKPFHYDNARMLLSRHFGAITVDGMEADDALCIEQTRAGTASPYDAKTIICSRDKDLMQCPGWHYGWETFNQGEVKPVWVDELGWLELGDKRKLRGAGYKWFAAQVLMGDSVDNISGSKGYGPVKTFKLLDGCNSEEELNDALFSHFKDRSLLMEQIDLVWMVREMVNGFPILWDGYVLTNQVRD